MTQLGCFQRHGIIEDLTIKANIETNAGKRNIKNIAGKKKKTTNQYSGQVFTHENGTLLHFASSFLLLASLHMHEYISMDSNFNKSKYIVFKNNLSLH